MEVPRVECPVGPFPPLPDVNPRATTDGVLFTPEDTRDLAKWIGEVLRWQEMASACLNLDTPESVGAESGEAAVTRQIAPIVAGMGALGAKTEVRWITCKEENAFYVPALRAVWLCRELLDLPVTRVQFYAAHEMAHAVIHQRRIPFTGSEEVAADELATWFLLKEGYHDAVRDQMAFWLKRAWPEDPFDEHSGDTRRGATGACLLAGRRWQESKAPIPTPCAFEWVRVSATWTTLLAK